MGSSINGFKAVDRIRVVEAMEAISGVHVVAASDNP